MLNVAAQHVHHLFHPDTVTLHQRRDLWLLRKQFYVNVESAQKLVSATAMLPFV
jgi:hypothetical protein